MAISSTTVKVVFKKVKRLKGSKLEVLESPAEQCNLFWFVSRKTWDLNFSSIFQNEKHHQKFTRWQNLCVIKLLILIKGLTRCYFFKYSYRFKNKCIFLQLNTFRQFALDCFLFLPLVPRSSLVSLPCKPSELFVGGTGWAAVSTITHL